jgi:ketosteroid isomerase-like protein
VDDSTGPERLTANLDLVRSIYAAWERGDYGYVGWAHPDIEYVSVDGPEPGTWVGALGMAKGWIGWLGAWENFRVEAEQFRELDEERVLVLDHSTGRGRASGLQVERSSGAVLFQIRDSKVARIVAYWDRERGLLDLGLASEVGTPDP